VTNYRTTETTTITYGKIDGRGMEVVETKVVTEHEELVPTIKPPEGGITVPSDPGKFNPYRGVVPNTYNPYLYYPHQQPWPDGTIICNASVYDLDKARANRASS
jgi:hypothetical protein